MASTNWQGGKAKTRATAKAWLRHNDRERRADPQTKHANLDIDADLTAENYELGPTAGMDYAGKCRRLDGLLDGWGYGDDGTVCMQARVVYPPDAVVDDPALLRAWFTAAADVIVGRDGADNVVGMYVDVDEVHDYTDARTGDVRRAKPHMHVYTVPVVDAPAKPKRLPLYLTPDGKETTDEMAAARVYRTPCGGESRNVADAALNDDGEPLTCPRRARGKTGRAKTKKVAPPADAPVVRRLCGSDFAARARIIDCNDALERMTRERFGVTYNNGEPRDPERQHVTVEELKSRSAAQSAAVDIVEEANAYLLARAEEADAIRAAADEYADDTIHAANVTADGIGDYTRKARADADAYAADARARADDDLDEAARLLAGAQQRDSSLVACTGPLTTFIGWVRRSYSARLADEMDAARDEYKAAIEANLAASRRQADDVARARSRRRIPDVPRANNDGNGYGLG